MAKLFELTKDFLEAKEMLYDEEKDTETVLNTLDCIDCMIEEKADGYAKILQYIYGDISTVDNEIKRLTKIKKMLENRSKDLKEHLKQCMEVIGKTKFQTALYSFSIAQNGGVQPVKVDADVKDIPQEYLIPQPPKPDTNAIRKALEEGEVLHFAHLEERGTSLRIR
ncbi:MAG: siphovirus Gp157 family protein [Firmicutes bacterium]|nr:siphovirus Gp157 family protein [Bacillota bacterium]